MGIESAGYVADSAAGEEFVSVIDGQLDRVTDWLARVRGLARPLPLGQNPVGAAMSEKFAKAAEGGPDSFVAVLEAYRGVLESARAAVTESFREYDSRDQAYAGDYRRVEQGGAP